MTLLQTIVSGLRAVGGNRMRSLLTSLGILIGVCALIVTVGIGTGARASIGKGLTRLGTNLIAVTPGTVTVNGVRQGLGVRTTLTMADVKALSDPTVAPDVLAVSPLVSRSGLVMTAGSTTWTSTALGTSPAFLTTAARFLDSGSFFTDADMRTSAHVVVLGSTTARNLFGAADPVGSYIRIQTVPFRVVGILQVVGATGTQNPDDVAIVPLTTAQENFLAPVSTVPVRLGQAGPLTVGSATAGLNKMLTAVQRILVSATSRETIDAARQEVTQVLLNTHGMSDPSEADFITTTQEQILNTLDTTSSTLTLLLAGVAGVSLLVGGIGVMNIMLVSVTERIGEIGLRKALGATRSDILRQFLIEAASLSAGGGILGVVLGGLSAYLLSTFTTLAVVFLPAVAAIGVIIAAVIGVAFGVLPALRAARLAPIQALRAA
ncbi:MAG TPA: ABC transporter permease [Candidatus Dormibacteraeota bacterium]|nr:ABC transporter permease [Candidatus Dormibacteraeota bacterium]